MSDDTVISVRNVSKVYRIWESPAARLVSPLQASAARLLPEKSAAARHLQRTAAGHYQDFYALSDVSLEVKRGESVGVIGRNGSGKSTLLQIIAGTLQPTSGSVQVKGRVAALLELGSGFNPEFTGRENVYLNSAVLGLSRQQVDERFGAVAAFADIGDFIDRPVKTYSSGMALRLAFSVQIQLQPDVLIIDEALSVGDEAFQRKCFTRIGQMMATGVTILFVSHSGRTIVELCQRAMVLDLGRRLLTGHPKPAIQFYTQLCYASPEARAGLLAEIARADAGLPPAAAVSAPDDELGSPPASADAAQDDGLSSARSQGDAAPPPAEAAPSRPGAPAAYFLESLRSETRSEFPERGARILDLKIHDAANRSVNLLVPGDTYTLRVRVAFRNAASRVRFGWTAKSVSGVILTGAATHQPGNGFDGFNAGDEVEIAFRFHNLFNCGTYFINVAVRALMEEPDVIIHGIADALMFKVDAVPGQHRNGYVDCTAEPVWSIARAKIETAGR
jgi:lipopolysaccharide transport system ATP-binding protein